MELPESCGHRVMIEWIMANLDVPHIRPKDAPSRGAWSWREAIRKSQKMRTDFFNTHVKQLAPKMENAIQDRFIDDGRELALIDRIRKASLKAEGERTVVVELGRSICVETEKGLEMIGKGSRVRLRCEDGIGWRLDERLLPEHAIGKQVGR